MLQLIFYKLLLNNSREYKDYRVTKGHILFVTPDKDGEVHDKVYELGLMGSYIIRMVLLTQMALLFLEIAAPL